MNTPICDFLKKYRESKTVRLHMPGHKGAENPNDITEISGADSLYEADGIIAESERNASALFGCNTFYSTEGSSHCIRAMLWLCLQYAKENGKKPVILAGRNAHRAFISAAVLCDLEVEWLYPEKGGYLSCDITGERLDKALSEMKERPVAVYLTSPDYLGNMLNIAELSSVCHKHGVFLLVDNAHGAYLKFLENSLHPIDLGADMCCDSAHKTLPVLTGGAYLHVADDKIAYQAKDALCMFGSTSPSYLILESLDRANAYLSSCKEGLAAFVSKIEALKQKLVGCGYELLGTEPMKIAISATKYGYKGVEIADILRKNGIEPEFADTDALVLMPTDKLTDSEFARLEIVLLSLEKREPIEREFPANCFSPKTSFHARSGAHPERKGRVDESVGRVAALGAVSCPPAVDIVVPGENITEEAVKAMLHYGIEYCTVIK